METWRRFIQEQKNRGVRIPEERTCLYSEIEAENAYFVLYGHGSGQPGDALMNLSVIGSVNLESLDDSGPCISGKPNENPAWPAYKKYFMHGTSHYLGLDVHDYGLWTIPMEEGMVFTVEPGIYIPEEGLGIRIEDDIVITKDGHENLTRAIPKTVEEIEEFMAQ